MSKTRNYNPDTLAVMERFFTAIEACKQQKLIKTVTTYCAECGIDAPHFYTQRKDRTRGFFEIGWAVPLIRNCGVSSRWLLTGVGSMFAE